MDLLEFNPNTFNGKIRIDSEFESLFNKIWGKSIHVLQPETVTDSKVEDVNNDCKLECIENGREKSYVLLNAEKGCHAINKKLIGAYSKSIAIFNTLEGRLARVSHSLLYMNNGTYYPSNQLSSLFCTASSTVYNKIKGSIFVENGGHIGTAINIEIAKQKGCFIVDNCFKNSILLIDEPLLAGDGLGYFYKTIKLLAEQNIISAFVVKNSCSTLIVENIPELNGYYNSDIHFASESLREGSRSLFYKYTDNKTPDMTKVFCYLKYSNRHNPFRIEFMSPTFYKNREIVDLIMDMIYYLIHAQGSLVNPQVRLIAMAEKYAKETLRLGYF